MKHFTGKSAIISAKTAVSIGKFDGVHRGHVAIFDELKRVAAEKDLKTLVLTFAPHPMSYFTGKHFQTILDPKEKFEIFQKMGIDYYIELDFDDEFAQTTPEMFMREILSKQLNAHAMVVAQEYRFGAGGKGNVELAKKVGAELGIDVFAIPHIVHDGHKIGSDYLRKLILEKNFALMSELCGRSFYVTGKVVHGMKNGHKLGFPTANITPHPDKILPPNGVYATTTLVDGVAYKSITNIGLRPTVDAQNTTSTLETHILDYCGDLYGKFITVIFEQWMRNEQKFDSMDELSAMLAANCIQRREMV
ncbi:MAG: bifunctional riboflavin kinase/FAD synthetase [Defluviitaleaceae bacterium]|nr:bifunctional riboflavin kinase/FAD synthetase [Defluviitaleaceae bacterium]